MPSDEAQTELDEELLKLRQETTMPGFRRGRVPMSIIRQRYGKALELDILQKRLFDYYNQAIKEADIGEPIAPPDMEIVQFELGKPLIFKAKVEIEPPIELAPYDSLTIVRERVKITGEEIDKHLERLREQHAILQESDQPADTESLLEVNLQEMNAGFVPIIGRKRESVLLDLSKSAPEFRDQLVGVSAGENRNVSLLRPPKTPESKRETDYYQVTVKTVKHKEIPELNDEFATLISSDIKSMEELRVEVEKLLTAQVEAISYQRMAHLLAHQVVDNSRLDVPEMMLNNYLDRMVEDARKNITAEEEKHFDEKHIRENFKQRATWNLRWYLIRKKIAVVESQQVEEDDLQKEYERIAARTDKKLKQVQAKYAERKNRSQLEDDIVERKVLEFLVSKANIIEREVSFEEFFARDAEDHHER